MSDAKIRELQRRALETKRSEDIANYWRACLRVEIVPKPTLEHQVEGLPHLFQQTWTLTPSDLFRPYVSVVENPELIAFGDDVIVSEVSLVNKKVPIYGIHVTSEKRLNKMLLIYLQELLEPSSSALQLNWKPKQKNPSSDNRLRDRENTKLQAAIESLRAGIPLEPDSNLVKKTTYLDGSFSTAFTFEDRTIYVHWTFNHLFKDLFDIDFEIKPRPFTNKNLEIKAWTVGGGNRLRIINIPGKTVWDRPEVMEALYEALISPITRTNPSADNRIRNRSQDKLQTAIETLRAGIPVSPDEISQTSTFRDNDTNLLLWNFDDRKIVLRHWSDFTHQLGMTGDDCRLTVEAAYSFQKITPFQDNFRGKLNIKVSYVYFRSHLEPGKELWELPTVMQHLYSALVEPIAVHKKSRKLKRKNPRGEENLRRLDKEDPIELAKDLDKYYQWLAEKLRHGEVIPPYASFAADRLNRVALWFPLKNRIVRNLVNIPIKAGTPYPHWTIEINYVTWKETTWNVSVDNQLFYSEEDEEIPEFFDIKNRDWPPPDNWWADEEIQKIVRELAAKILATRKNPDEKIRRQQRSGNELQAAIEKLRAGQPITPTTERMPPGEFWKIKEFDFGSRRIVLKYFNPRNIVIAVELYVESNRGETLILPWEPSRNWAFTSLDFDENLDLPVTAQDQHHLNIEQYPKIMQLMYEALIASEIPFQGDYNYPDKTNRNPDEKIRRFERENNDLQLAIVKLRAGQPLVPTEIRQLDEDQDALVAHFDFGPRAIEIIYGQTSSLEDAPVLVNLRVLDDSTPWTQIDCPNCDTPRIENQRGRRRCRVCSAKFIGHPPAYPSSDLNFIFEIEEIESEVWNIPEVVEAIYKALIEPVKPARNPDDRGICPVCGGKIYFGQPGNPHGCAGWDFHQREFFQWEAGKLVCKVCGEAKKHEGSCYIEPELTDEENFPALPQRNPDANLRQMYRTWELNKDPAYGIQLLFALLRSNSPKELTIPILQTLPEIKPEWVPPDISQIELLQIQRKTYIPLKDSNLPLPHNAPNVVVPGKTFSNHFVNVVHFAITLLPESYPISQVTNYQTNRPLIDRFDPGILTTEYLGWVSNNEYLLVVSDYADTLGEPTKVNTFVFHFINVEARKLRKDDFMSSYKIGSKAQIVHYWELESDHQDFNQIRTELNNYLFHHPIYVDPYSSSSINAVQFTQTKRNPDESSQRRIRKSKLESSTKLTDEAKYSLLRSGQLPKADEEVILEQSPIYGNIWREERVWKLGQNALKVYAAKVLRENLSDGLHYRWEFIAEKEEADASYYLGTYVPEIFEPTNVTGVQSVPPWDDVKLIERILETLYHLEDEEKLTDWDKDV